MSTPYDFRQDSIRRDLDAAFAAGEQRGRAYRDAHWEAECVDLRVRLAKRQVAAYRQGIEVALLMSCMFAAILSIVVGLTWWLS